MHHTQVGDVDSKIVLNGKRFEILVSETGVNFDEGFELAKALTKDQKSTQQLGELQDILALFQMGPRTGNQIFNEKYADGIFKMIRLKCPTGKISGLTSIRETAKYPVISGEIVKIIGYCKG